MAYLPMAVYGLEVPPGDMAVSARPDIPAAFRITMAAIDPSAEAEGEEGAPVRATLKIIRLPLTEDDFDVEDEEDFDPDEMDAILAGAEEDSEDEDDDDEDDDLETNGGPSDPSKTKKARKAAAEAAIQKLLEAEGMDVDEDDDEDVNGVDDDEDDEDSDDDDGAEIEEFVICTLDPQKQYQQTLDIAIGEDERVWFKVSGTHSIFLTGNYIEPAGNSYDEDDEEDSDDDELDYDLEPDSDELDDDEELDALDELADPISRVTEIEDDEEEAPELVKPKKERTSQEAGKEAKKNDGTAAAVNGKAETPASAKSDKKVAFAKEIEQGPTPSKPAEANGASIKTIAGVKIDVRKVGTGPAAKKGDRVSMRYIGKLENGKVFDSNKKGKPFSFKLGVGEVIKGWDIGVAGQCAGGELRLTIPAAQAYGSKSLPDIPANSTLIFDLKVLEISRK
ncbi:hypothetical protein AMS68_004011 [Peltaster fructicola]|uniref:FK506-binding protein n=1 Tax=Peltaster fructicola TaxID=286661 RepID=A0A6H0XUT6_9PEZI|nr:hypothetical protein AMS68_004011 [Peltaster fructicola]